MLTGDKGPKGDKGDDDCCAGCQNWSAWNPDVSQFCDGENFWQNRYCLDNSGVGSGIGSGGGGSQYEWQYATGTSIPDWGPWTPDPSTVCAGIPFTQTRTDLNGCQTNETQIAIGTSTPNWGPWTPDPSTQPYGQSFTQTRSDLNGKCENDTQFAVGTRICGSVSFDITGGTIVHYNYLSTGCVVTNTDTFTSYDGSTLLHHFQSSVGGTYTGTDPNYVCNGGYTIPNATYLEVGVGGGYWGGRTIFKIGDLYGYLQGSVTIVPPTTPGVYTYDLPITLVNRPTQVGSFAGVVTLTITPC